MKNKFLSILLCASVVLGMGTQSTVAYADSSRVVTLGADLTDAEKAEMYKYFGTTQNKVTELEVNNTEERKYLSGVATEQQIGKHTYSCCYIEPTEEGQGIKVAIANLTWVNSSMIASALTTAGIYDCNVVAAAPKEVSGTGALTGIFKAFEKVSEGGVDQEKAELATEELVTTGTLADELETTVGNDEEAMTTASGIMTDVKEQVIADKVEDKGEIKEIVQNTSQVYNVNLTETQVNNIVNIMVSVSQQNYEYDKLEGTFNTITDNASKELGIEKVNATVDNAKEEATGFFGTIGNFFKGIGKAIGGFFKAIGDWFMGLFGKDTSSNDGENSIKENIKEDLGIFENLDTSILGDDVTTDATEDKIEEQTETSAAPSTSAQPESTSSIPEATMSTVAP